MKDIKNIVSLFWQDLINLIHFSPKKKLDSDLIEYAKTLKNEGIITIPNYIDANFADSLKNQIENLAKQKTKSVELDNGTKFNYRNENNPDGPDHGMLDIFSIQNTIPEVIEVNQEKLIKILSNATGQEVIPLRTNAYINKGVKNTRAYHVDNTQSVIFKAFIYLTDVPNTDHGPYSFVKKSHRFSFYTYLNLFKNLFSKNLRSTDMPIFRKKRVVHVTGDRGNLILSNQNGIHRGLPQTEDSKRIALVFSFIIKSKLSFLHKSAKKSISENKFYTSQVVEQTSQLNRK